MSTDLVSHLHLREQVVKQIRDFLDQRGFHEVFPTLLNKSLPLEPTLYAYETQDHLYLPTSPESSLKKYLAATGDKCYSLASAFRALEVTGPLHRPEFLMLEIYEPGHNYQDLMTLTRDLLTTVIHPKAWEQDWPVLSFIDLFQKHCSLNLNDLIVDDTMRSAAASSSYSVKNSTWEQLFNQIFLNEIEPQLPSYPFFLTDYPARISPLAARQADHPLFAERFELYINGVELANGNTENSNVKEVKKAMDAEQKYRRQNDLPTHLIDPIFLKSLAKMPRPTAGVGLGLDRLIMLLNNAKRLPPTTF